MKLISAEQRIYPVRGLLLLQSTKGKPYALLDLKRWMRLNRIVHKTPKMDALMMGDRFEVVPELLDYAAREGITLSLRTDCTEAPRDLVALKEGGLFDVFLCPATPQAEHLDAWFEACGEAGLPMRLQLQAPFPKALDVEGLADRIAAAGVVAVNVALADPFSERPSCRDKAESQATVDVMNALAAAIEARDVESNLLFLPLCLVREENLIRAVNAPQFYRDHQQYAQGSHVLAVQLRRHGPIVLGKILLSRLGRDTLRWTPYDERLLNWLVHHPAYYIRAAFWRKLTKHLRVARSTPRERAFSREEYERELARHQRQVGRQLGPVCSRCRLRRICDHASPGFKRVLPGLSVSAQEGELVASPLHFSANQRKYYDPMDAERLEFEEGYLVLAEEAREAVRNRAPDRQLTSQDYDVEQAFFIRMEGGIMWFSMFNCEKLSTPLATLEPPFTLSVTFGGGIADYVGFSFERTCKLLCPMEQFRHEVTLHVAEDGRYVLLRDGHPVRPVEFEGEYYVPLRLPQRVTPRIAIWNIETNIVTHLINIWERPDEPADLSRVKYSVVVMCTRYARRLQATLACLAHQQGFDLRRVEVLIAYVPGIDAVDDVIESMQQAHPQLRIVRSAFAEQKALSKGFMINETVKMAAGEWIVLMDADTLAPPDLFAKADAVANQSHFIAPDGRKMLPADITAKILLGEVQPWDVWDDLLEGSGEYRRREAQGTPIGFCQFVRAKCIKEVRYVELEHFEYSDMQFGREMRARFGKETWLTGTPVLHLDHGGSHWYGTQTHR